MMAISLVSDRPATSCTSTEDGKNPAFVTVTRTPPAGASRRAVPDASVSLDRDPAVTLAPETGIPWLRTMTMSDASGACACACAKPAVTTHTMTAATPVRTDRAGAGRSTLMPRRPI